MVYRREIDGLRAIAVLPVILFHAGFARFSGGFVGVDVFFVISGYLITTLILTDARAGRFTLLGFYERRARRILPALFLVMAVSIPFAWLWMLPTDLKDFSESLAAAGRNQWGRPSRTGADHPARPGPCGGGQRASKGANSARFKGLILIASGESSPNSARSPAMDF
ncbi:MAG: acyltransferase, partial [Alphaproteobacteria bacterium]|nr:acyltransferase [Alphaproteobacteria bacterium]